MPARRLAPRAALAALLPIALGASLAPPAYMANAIADPARPAADVARDADRKPAAMLVFAEVKPNETVVDYVPGGGYFTRLFSGAVGPGGAVYAITPDTFARKFPHKGPPVSSEPGRGNVRELIASPDTAIDLPGPADLVWTAQNYHDIHILGGPAAALALDRAVFAALKPGGRFVIADHAGAPGLGEDGIKALHRIDEATVKKEVLAAGFTLDGESDALRNPADSRALSSFDPSVRGRTDQFVLRFRKPAKVRTGA
jgi:predicted methyltransferase